MDEAAALYRSLLAGKRVLVLLDNAIDTEHVRPLLTPGTASLMLATSRDRLDGLVARDGAHRLRLDVPPWQEACELLNAALREHRITAEPGELAELVERSGQLPLALRIVAVRLAAQPERADRLLAALHTDRLSELAVESDPTLSVRAALDQSYQRLSPADRRLLHRLVTTAGARVTPAAAAARADLTVNEACRALDRLAAAHLLCQTRDCYRLPALLNDYMRAIVQCRSSANAS